MPQFRFAQSRYLSLILLGWLLVFFLTRSILFLTHIHEAAAGPIDLLRIFGIGMVYDLGFLLYAALPIALYLLLCPERLWRTHWHRSFLFWLLIASMFAVLFVAVAEWLFWDEFGVRFNFIAVDYLVYSKEVVQNIIESYPIYPLLSALFAVAVVGGVALRRYITGVGTAPFMPRRYALFFLSVLALAAFADYRFIKQDMVAAIDTNVYQRELARNGPFQFFAAFRNNELDYRQFYASLNDARVTTLLQAELAEPNARFEDGDQMSIRRYIDNAGQEQYRNVILVTVESLSAKYLGSFGDTHGLTPNLDRLRREGLFFTNLYATGTRTDRGLEAITLSIPPTPGRSIVKRIGRETGYASLGRQLDAKGYDSVFLYGGRGYFDNMNAFFGGNGYRIIDQSSVAAQDIHFENAWGMCDEDLYAQALKVADQDSGQGKPFFLHLMTTSNHRPYTYPDGRIDIPSGSGREGAVKYTDYAIGQFMAQASRKPWFGNTVFIFVADHTAGSAGKEDLPVANYHIPLFIVAPGLVAPRDVTTLASQIDIAPTLLGLLNIDYESTFFGRNVLLDETRPGRALVGNYQHLGLFDGKDMAILSPRGQMRRHDDALDMSYESRAGSDDPLVSRDIAYYQGASLAFREHLLVWRPPSNNEYMLSLR